MNSNRSASRERVLDALNRREPDRIPFDLGSSIETGITVQAYDRFIELMGWTEEPDETLPNLFVQPDVPPENLRAAWETLQEYADGAMS